MSGYIKAMRPVINLFVVLLVIASFQIARLDLRLAILPAIAIFVIACATMVENDLRDREHDQKKSKTHAAEHSKQYAWFAAALWVVSLVLCVALGMTAGTTAMMIGLATMAIGLAYSEVLLVPWVPNLLVAVCSALATLFPLSYAVAHPWKTWFVFVVVFGTIYGREVVKDLEDQEIDRGHKWTVPVAKGYEWARRVAIIAYVLGTLALFPLFPDGNWRAFGWLPLPGVVAIMKFCEGYKLSQRDFKVLELGSDLGMLLVLLLWAFLGQHS